MPETRNEPDRELSLLRKQLILSQVQILELEDTRDELKSALEHRAEVLAELQEIADGALADASEANAAKSESDRAARDLISQRDQIRQSVAKLEQEAAVTNREVAEVRRALDEARGDLTAHTSRIATLDAEMRAVKASRSWRWMGPLRSLERLLR